jgi:hypothetical protein
VHEATSSGGLTATMTVAEPPPPAEACLLISTDTLDYGTVELGETATSPTYTVTSCSSAAQSLYAHATDAAISAATVRWTLTTSPRAIDEFSVDANRLDTGNEWLTDAAAPMGSLPAGAAAPGRTHQLATPPTGRTGGGQTMSFELIWTAVVSSP